LVEISAKNDKFWYLNRILLELGRHTTSIYGLLESPWPAFYSR